MKKILKKIRDIVYSIILFPIVFFCKNMLKRKKIFCECYIHSTLLHFKKRNWGDDLNKFFFEYISSIKILNFPFSKMIKIKNIDVFSMIGSILSLYKIENKIIYGTGVMYPDCKFIGQPKEIISVRGPKTREVLLKNGIDCPKCYGDPVLLLPVFYIPKIEKKRKGGLILNMGTNCSKLKEYSAIINNLNLKIISMTKYEKWTDVIDEICSCQYIISESLHGLIVAETYGIPNVWVEFKDHPSHWNFKFQDFYESIDKNEEIIKIKKTEDIIIAVQKVKTWKKGCIDYDKLINLYPFEIKKRIFYKE